jgi:hypothetical protein
MPAVMLKHLLFCRSVILIRCNGHLRRPLRLEAVMSRRRLMLCLSLSLALLPGLAAADDGAWPEIRVGGVAESQGEQYDVRLVAINGSRDVRAASTYELTPGPQQLRLASEKRGVSGVTTSQVLAVDLRPCMRYELVADHAQATANRSWRPAVKSETPIKSCIKKHGISPGMSQETAAAAP